MAILIHCFKQGENLSKSTVARHRFTNDRHRKNSRQAIVIILTSATVELRFSITLKKRKLKVYSTINTQEHSFALDNFCVKLVS